MAMKRRRQRTMKMMRMRWVTRGKEEDMRWGGIEKEAKGHADNLEGRNVRGRKRKIKMKRT